MRSNRVRSTLSSRFSDIAGIAKKIKVRIFNNDFINLLRFIKNNTLCIKGNTLHIAQKYHSLIVELNEPNSMIAPKHIISMTNDFHDSRAWRPLR